MRGYLLYNGVASYINMQVNKSHSESELKYKRIKYIDIEPETK